MQVWNDDGLLEIRGTLRRTLLASLLIHQGTVVSMDQLTETVWGYKLPASPDAALYNQITRLRRSLGVGGERIEAISPGYVIHVEPGELDTREFEERCGEARRAAHENRWEEASKSYADALSLWRGRPLADVPALEAHPIVLHLEEARLLALQGRTDAELNLGRHDEVVGVLRTLVAEHPLREAFQGQLMVALHRAGRQAEALSTYAKLRQTMLDELGEEPSASTQDLHLRILRSDPELMPGPLVPVEARVDDDDSGGAANASSRNVPRRSDNQGQHQLPADPRIFIGREAELESLLALADEAARDDVSGATVVISAIDGMAGVGKSTLAVHAAQAVRRSFPDGQYFLDLHGHTPGVDPLTPEQALDSLLRSLGAEPGAIPQSLDERAAVYRDQLHGTRSLIVLDNARSAAQVRPLMPGSAGCMVLVTSRRRLTGLEDAHAIALDLLSEQDAAALLHRIAGPGRIPDDHPAISELIALCGHLPLAIRITAARLRRHRFLRVEEVVDQLRAGPSIRLARLADDERGLEAVFESSYTALPPDEQQMFRRLGLTSGPDFGVHAAASLADTDLATAERLLESLLDHNLLIQHAAGRYRFHDLMRLYARAAADRDESEQSRHAALERLLSWYAATARSLAIIAYPTWSGQQLPPRVGSIEPIAVSDARQALDWFELERDQLLASVQAAEDEGLLPYGWLLPAVLWPFTELRGRFGDRLMLAEIGLRCAQRLQDGAARNLMLRSKSTALNAVGRYDESIEVGLWSLELVRREGTRVDEAKQLSNLAFVYTRNEQLDEAIQYGRESLRLFELLGEEDFEIPARLNLSGALITNGRATEAIPIISRAVELSRRPRNGVHLGGCLGQLGSCLANLDPPDYAAAEACLLEGLDVVRSVGNRHHEVQTLAELGVLYEATGRPAEALAHLRACRQLGKELGFELYHVFRDALDRLERAETPPE